MFLTIGLVKNVKVVLERYIGGQHFLMESSSWKTSSTTPYKFIATGKIKVSKTVFVAKLHVTCLKERGWGEEGSWLRPLLVSYTKFNSNICIKKKIVMLESCSFNTWVWLFCSWSRSNYASSAASVSSSTSLSELLLQVNHHGVKAVLLAHIVTQLTFTCSKSTTETLEKDVKYVQS